MTVDILDSGSGNSPVFSFNDAKSTIQNSIFSNCGSETAAFAFTENSSIDYCGFWQTGLPTAVNGELGENIWEALDPQFASPENQVYTLLPYSFALNAASDGNNLGDMFWSVENGQPDNNAYLGSILVNGNEISGFDPQKFNYDVKIADADNYEVIGNAQSESATVKVHYPNAVPGQLFIAVEAENAINLNYYILNLSIGTGIPNSAFTYNLDIYPNPNTGEFYITNTTPGYLNFYTTSGKMIKSMFISGSAKVEVHDLIPGIYFLQYKTNENTQINKLIIN